MGLAHGAVKESLVRIRAAIIQAGYTFPRGAVTVNLAPADTRKDGSAFDLPIALGILAADRQIDPGWIAAEDVLVIGELSLEGLVRPVSGVMPAMLCASEAGLRHALIPADNAPEAEAFSAFRIGCVETLAEAIRHVREGEWKRGLESGTSSNTPTTTALVPDFSQVVGQSGVIRALAIAAVGRHNVLMTGPPGCGKTLMARCLQGVLPPWSHELALEATCLHSLRKPGIRLLARRPFRAPHHSVSPAGLLGGGNPLRPGEVSLAHGGILFLDELPEFGPRALEGLREPMEERSVTLSRAREVESFPADFQLVAAMNPCPCGMGGRSGARCTCSDRRKWAYRGRVSGPLLDRIDIHLSVPPVDPNASLEAPTEDSKTLRQKISAAALRLNEDRPVVGKAAEASLVRASSSLRLSMRAVSSVRRISQTIAAYEGSEEVLKAHVAEAIRLGGQGRRFVAD